MTREKQIACSYIPSLKPSKFAIIAIVRQESLGPDEEDLAVKDEDAAVVADAMMEDRHADVAEEVGGEVRLLGGQQPGHGLPAVEEGVHLEEVVFAGVPAHLQLGADSVASLLLLGLRQ